MKEGQEFLDNNAEATKEEYDEKRKELEREFFSLRLEYVTLSFSKV
jgi:ribosomal protein L29